MVSSQARSNGAYIYEKDKRPGSVYDAMCELDSHIVLPFPSAWVKVARSAFLLVFLALPPCWQLPIRRETVLSPGRRRVSMLPDYATQPARQHLAVHLLPARRFHALIICIT